MREKSPARPTPRWGLRTLAFLALAATSVVTSNVLRAQGNVDLVLLTFSGTMIGLVGAGVCTVRGLQSLRGPGSRE